MNVKLTDLWIKRLLFDLLTGASLLALAKSIYYGREIHVPKRIW